MVDPLLQARYALLDPWFHDATVQIYLGEDRHQPERPQPCWIYIFSIREGEPSTVQTAAQELFEYEVKHFELLAEQAAIAPLLDTFTLAGRFYVVQGRSMGETLANLLKGQAPRPAQWVMELVRSLLETLTVVHSHHTLHGNLAPENVFWRSQSQTWQLLNFGAFHQIGLLTERDDGEITLQGRLGVPDYCPPEPDAPLNAQHDLYGVGAIALEALTGERTPERRQQAQNYPDGAIADYLLGLLTGEFPNAPAALQAWDEVTLTATEAWDIPLDSAISTVEANPDADFSAASAEGEALPPGTRLAERYRLVRTLSAGGFGQTYVAIDEQFPGQPQCVVKKLKPQDNSERVQKIAAQLFEREAEVLSRLGRHEQIPQLMAHFEEQGEFYLVEEFVAGHDLKAEMPLGAKWTEAQVMQLLQEILDVLSFVHQQRVIHRDLKPANIRRREQDGKLVLIDFGAVKQLSEVTQINATDPTKLTVSIGTAGFAPSEQMQGRPRLSSDVYAVGMIAIQALTGCDPEDLPEDPNTGEVLWQHLAPVSAPFAAFLARMVRYDFRQRYDNARQALIALRRLGVEDALLPLPESPLLRSPLQRIRWRWVLGCLGSIVVVGSVGLWGRDRGWFAPSPAQITQRLAGSLVPVRHGDGQGYSNGIVVTGRSRRCTILTTPDAIASGEGVSIDLDGSQQMSEDVQTFVGLDLIQLTFPSPVPQCPLPALPLGDSRAIAEGDTVYVGNWVAGEPDLHTTTLTQHLSIPITGGYRLGYTGPADAVAGAVLLNRDGQLIGIQGPISDAELNEASQGLDWAIPIRSYQVEIDPTLHTDAAEALKDEADRFFAAQEYAPALEAYDRLIRLQTDNPAAWYGRGSSLYNLERYTEAIAAFEEALALRPNNALIWYSKGNAQFRLQRYAEARLSYEEAIERKPDYFTAMNNLGLVAQALGDLDEAAQLFAQVIEIRPRYYPAWNNQGTILMLKGDTAGALESYNRAISLQANYANAWYNRAIAYAQRNEPDVALDNLQRAIELRRDWANQAQADPNFAPLRNHPQFQTLISGARSAP